jgi:hypothetical protein
MDLRLQTEKEKLGSDWGLYARALANYFLSIVYTSLPNRVNFPCFIK